MQLRQKQERINITNKRVLLVTPIMIALANNAIRFNVDVMDNSIMSGVISNYFDWFVNQLKVVRDANGKLTYNGRNPYVFINQYVEWPTNELLSSAKFISFDSDTTDAVFQTRDSRNRVMENWNKHYYPEAYLNQIFVPDEGKGKLYSVRVNPKMSLAAAVNDMTSNTLTKPLGFIIDPNLHIKGRSHKLADIFSKYGRPVRSLDV